LSYVLVDDPAAFEHFSKSIALDREVGDVLGLAFACGAQSESLDGSNEPSAALLETIGDPQELAFDLICRGVDAANREDPAAPGLVEEGVRRLRAFGDRWFAALLLEKAAYAGGVLEWQERLLRDSLELAREMHDEIAVVNAMYGLAMRARWKDDTAQAVALYDQCLSRFRSLAIKLGVAGALHGRGMVDLRLGDVRHARCVFIEGLLLYAEANHVDGVVWSLMGLAGVATSAGAEGARHAARMLGAGDVMSDGLFSGWEGTDGVAAVEYLRIADAARALLDPAEWDAAWAQGQALTLEQAIAYALGNADET
jgi:hypothetical protein